MSAFVNTLKTAYNKLIAKPVPKQITQCDKAKWRLFQQLFISLAMLTRVFCAEMWRYISLPPAAPEVPKKRGQEPKPVEKQHIQPEPSISSSSGRHQLAVTFQELANDDWYIVYNIPGKAQSFETQDMSSVLAAFSLSSQVCSTSFCFSSKSASCLNANFIDMGLEKG